MSSWPAQLSLAATRRATARRSPKASPGPHKQRARGRTEKFGYRQGTVGVGWERQISQLWGINVEYRYTKFLSKSDDLPSNNVQGFLTAPGPAGSGTTTITNFSNTSARLNAELQTVSVGISRYFGP